MFGDEGEFRDGGPPTPENVTRLGNNVIYVWERVGYIESSVRLF
jgi:hypothetical protein